MISEIQTRYGSLVRRQGRSRCARRYHASSAPRTAARRSGASSRPESGAGGVCRDTLRRATALTFRRRRLRSLELGLDVLLDPLGVEPLDRIDERAVEHHAEVQVVATGQTGVAAAPQCLAAGRGLPLLDR